MEQGFLKHIFTIKLRIHIGRNGENSEQIEMETGSFTGSSSEVTDENDQVKSLMRMVR